MVQPSNLPNKHSAGGGADTNRLVTQDHDDDLEGGDNNDDDGYPAYSHHDRFPPWWVFVHDDYGGNLSGDKIPP